MSFFDAEEAHAVMLAHAAYGGPVDQRCSGPGSSPPEAGKGKKQAQSTRLVRCKKRYPYPLIAGIQAG